MKQKKNNITGKYVLILQLVLVWTPLCAQNIITAIENDNVDLVRKLLIKSPKIVSQQFMNNMKSLVVDRYWFPLHFAAKQGNQ